MKKFLLTTALFGSLSFPFSCEAADISLSEVVLQGLDKVTGRLSTMTVPVGEKATFEGLDIYARVCYTKPPEETPENASFLEIVERKKEGQLKLFSGWMFSSSPALSAMNHAVYDIWVLRCQGIESTPPKPEPLVLENPLEMKAVQPKVKIQWQEEAMEEENTEEIPVNPETLAPEEQLLEAESASEQKSEETNFKMILIEESQKEVPEATNQEH